eukprot:3140896-Rhodomonas_salina.4
MQSELPDGSVRKWEMNRLFYLHATHDRGSPSVQTDPGYADKQKEESCIADVFFNVYRRITHEGSLIPADLHALLVVGGGLVVGVGDGVRGDTVGVVRLRPGVDGVNVLEHGHLEEGEHRSWKKSQVRPSCPSPPSCTATITQHSTGLKTHHVCQNTSNTPHIPHPTSHIPHPTSSKMYTRSGIHNVGNAGPQPRTVSRWWHTLWCAAEDLR